MPRSSTNTTIPPTYVSDDPTSTPIQQTNQPIITIPPQANPGLVGSFDKTNLDTENALPNGGIPYSQAGDPTVYPKTTNQQSPNRGYFATPGKAPSKFEQKYSSKNTYLDFIQKYI
jgi:hypothetical protein